MSAAAYIQNALAVVDALGLTTAFQAVIVIMVAVTVLRMLFNR